MSALNDLLRRIRSSGTFDEAELQATVTGEIASRTGAHQGAVGGRSESTVASLSLHPVFMTFDIEAAVFWMSGRIIEARAEVFEIRIAREASKLSLVATWQWMPSKNAARCELLGARYHFQAA